MPGWLISPRTRSVVIDVALTALSYLVTVSQWGSQGFDQFPDVAREPDGIGFLLVLVAVLPVLVRRWNPLGVLLLTGTASVGLIALGYGVLIYLGPAVALYTLAASRTEADVRVALGIGFAVAVWATSSILQLTELGADGSALTVGALIWLGAWLLGDRVREGRRRRVERTERTVAEERAHIARELHDSAGHAINVILVQAGAARVLHERDPARSRDALATVETVARETLGEIDRLVGALRDGDGDGTAPLPGIAGIDTLVKRHRGGGLIVTAETRGTPRALGAAVDRAAYRIAQEALTNAARHGGSRAHITLDYRASELCLTVSNPFDPAAPAPNRRGGRGLVGMRERATLLGGGLEASREGGDFRVTAILPYDAPEVR